MPWEERGGRRVNQLTLKKTFKKIPSAAFALIFLLIIYTIFTDRFWTAENFINLAQQATVLAILSLGMTLVILSEGIDLSAGALVSLCGVVMAVYLHQGIGIFGAVLISIGVGVAAGIVNGLFIAKAKLPPFVVTLGTMGMFQGLALVITEGSSIPGFSDSFKFIACGFIMGIPFPIVILAFLVLITYLILYHTTFGTYIFSIGGNQEAVNLAGVSVAFYKSLIYVVAGAFAGVGGLVMTSRMNAAHPWVTLGLEFDAIVAVILGGTSFVLGKGNPFGSLVGAATIAILKNGMNILGVPIPIQVAFVGIFLILAIIYDSIKGD